MEHSIEPGTDSMLPTRQSLLSRLRDWQDQEGWREFFERYWRLIYKVARTSGLNDSDAQEVVQTTFIYLSRKMPKFRYDGARGSFKSWLRVVTRSRIHVYLRGEKVHHSRIREPLPNEAGDYAEEEKWVDRTGDALDEIWQREWEENLMSAAFRRLRSKVTSQQLLIFRLATLEGVTLAQVSKRLRVGLPQVYLARHRVGKLFKAEVERLRKETE